MLSVELSKSKSCKSLADIYCFPFAGGNARNFSAFSSHVKKLNVIGIDYPGRGARFGEPFAVCMDELANSIADAIFKQDPSNFLLLGHSMGADLAFKTAQKLEKLGLNPLCVFLSARQAPEIAPRREPIHHLPSSKFRSEMHSLGGTNLDVLKSIDLMEVFEPILRADFRLAEERILHDITPIRSPIVTIFPKSDPFLRNEDVSSWRKYTHGKYEHLMLDGDHFYIVKKPEFLAYFINECIRKLV